MRFLRSDRALPALENIRSQMLEVGKMNRVSMYAASQSLVLRTRFKALAANDRGISGSFDSVHIPSRFKSLNDLIFPLLFKQTICM